MNCEYMFILIVASETGYQIYSCTKHTNTICQGIPKEQKPVEEATSYF